MFYVSCKNSISIHTIYLKGVSTLFIINGHAVWFLFDIGILEILDHPFQISHYKHFRSISIIVHLQWPSIIQEITTRHALISFKVRFVNWYLAYMRCRHHIIKMEWYSLNYCVLGVQIFSQNLLSIAVTRKQVREFYVEIMLN